MKFSPFLFFLLLSLSGCDGDRFGGSAELESTATFVASPDQPNASYVPLYIHDVPAPEDINASPIPTGAFGQIIKPDMNRLQAQVLTRAYWVIDGYADSNGSNLQRRHGIGQWFQFNTNGTFTGGHWDRQTHAGAWYIDYQLNYPRLTIDSNVDRLDAVWELQALNGDQTAMALVRVNDGEFGTKTPEGISIRMGILGNKPTKQQYAKELGQ